MADTFTTEEAYEASDAGEPIMVSRRAAEAIFAKHDLVKDEVDRFWAEVFQPDMTEIDAAELIGWLGY